jgi:hypothetical protein
MALMLRQECEEILKREGLGEYHVDIANGHQKVLTLFNPCGEVFVGVPGITFGSMKPTKAEVTYAHELLDRWLVANRKKIVRFLAAKELFAATPLPVIHRKGLKINNESKWVDEDNRRRMVTIPKTCTLLIGENTKITFNLDGKISDICCDFKDEDAVDPQSIPRISPNRKELKLVHAKLDEIRTYRSVKQEVSDARAELNTCCTV